MKKSGSKYGNEKRRVQKQGNCYSKTKDVAWPFLKVCHKPTQVFRTKTVDADGLGGCDNECALNKE